MGGVATAAAATAPARHASACHLASAILVVHLPPRLALGRAAGVVLPLLSTPQLAGSRTSPRRSGGGSGGN